jgi:hypothetical protein
MMFFTNLFWVFILIVIALLWIFFFITMFMISLLWIFFPFF